MNSGTPDVLEDLARIDLTDARLYSDDRPERAWKQMREFGRPIRSGGFREHWAVTRYRHIQEVQRNAHLFSSQKGMHLGEKPTDDKAGAAAGGLSLLVTDDPAHAEMRKTINTSFTPKLLRKLTDSTLQIARDLVSAVLDQGTFDFVEKVAAPLPTIVTCELLGVPDDDRDHVKELTQAAFSGSGYTTSNAQIAAHTKLFGYCHKLLAAKRRRPGNDVATVLANATMYDQPIRPEIAVMNCHDLIAGGNETARHTSSAGALTLVTDPGEWAMLRAGRADPDTATEEILRLGCPVSHVMRVATEDVEIGGTRMHAGEFVTLWLRSANRDPEVFDRPDTLDFTRKPNRHLTFGLGSHYCIAAFLARLEVGSIVKAMLELVGTAELRGDPVHLESNFFRGYRSLPMAFTSRA
ncbi:MULTISPECIES: cytochrome P450 [Amycolatopsis]|uniref:Cytochrome P450 n=1 Tax=Amycolatopsis dendrobii TaxID=2760662 RepID=A0A7W3VS89_9PSEU|nr:MULTISPECIES: cytochrome P450 [Amycolatopsis]MBB1151742.1 cytochrome P450 [Amycolatopsis dendrobii]UKD58045.1 cytochrome P450 [Amycolatopsis sp. FU40]